jgi:HlyD family secretion protein
MARMRLAAKIASVVGVLLVGAALYYWHPWAKPEDPRARFETTAIDRGDIVAKVTASGTLSALVTVQVGSQVSGRLKEIKANFNSQVKKGEVIARLDSQLFMAALEQARANYAAAQADLLKAKVQALDADRQLARAKRLDEQKLTARADFDTAQANADVSHAQVASAAGHVAQTQAALHQAEINLDYTTIESPIDGMVISRNVDVGQTVAASLQAPILFVIAENLHKMQVDTSVAEADVGKLRPDMVATFTVDAYPLDRFEGRVRQIRNAPQTLQNVVTYDAVIDVANPNLALRPGMTANVTFVHANRGNVLRAPNAALRFKPTPEMFAGPGRPGAGNHGPTSNSMSVGAGAAKLKRDERPDRRTVWVLRGSQPVAVPVKIGVTDGTHTEIVEGELHEGDAVITDLASTATPTGAGPNRGGASMPYRRIL